MDTTDTLDRTPAGTPAAETQAGTAPAVAEEGTAAGAVDGAGRARRLPSGWYLLGLAVQVFLWFLVFLGIAVAIGVGGRLTEFRYVGF